MKFDVVVGNPPYQAPTNSEKRKRHGGLWYIFLELGIKLCKPAGYIGMVFPRSWASVGYFGTDKYKLGIIKKNQIVRIKMDENRWFPGIGIGICSMILQKTESTKKTEVIHSNGSVEQIDFMEINSFPMKSSPLGLSVLKKIDTINAGRFYPHERRSISPNGYTSHVYQLISRFCPYHYIKTPAEFNATDKPRFGIPLKPNQIEGANTAFKTDLFKAVYILRGGDKGFIVMKTMPFVNLSKTWTDELMFKEFQLTTEEIQFCKELASVA